ncbi:MAG: hypothetical protein WC455_18750 [Dehalococcoidia bacterium]
MKTFFAILCVVLLLGCAHTGPTKEQCRTWKQSDPDIPCVPHVCAGTSNCIDEAIWLVVFPETLLLVLWNNITDDTDEPTPPISDPPADRIR